MPKQKEFLGEFDISPILATSYGRPDLNIEVEVYGKQKILDLPGDRTFQLSPGLEAVFSFADDHPGTEPGEETVTVGITGVLHSTTNEDGSVDTVATGRNLLFDPLGRDGDGALVITIGRFTYSVDEKGVATVPLTGHGQVIDILDLLAPIIPII